MSKSRVICATAPQIENVTLLPSFSFAGYDVSRPAFGVEYKPLATYFGVQGHSFVKQGVFPISTISVPRV